MQELNEVHVERVLGLTAPRSEWGLLTEETRKSYRRRKSLKGEVERGSRT